MRIVRLALAGLALAALAACGYGTAEGPSAVGMARSVLGGVLPDRAPAAPVAPRAPEEMAAAALAANPGPLVLAGIESQGTAQVLAMVGENGGTRTYMSPGDQALVLRAGMLVGTRGLGHDLASAEIGTEALIRGLRAGQAVRVMRFWTGDGRETPLRLRCDVTPGDAAGGGRQMIETCRAGAMSVENRYLVVGGAIPVSRQFVSPELGYVTLQALRP